MPDTAVLAVQADRHQDLGQVVRPRGPPCWLPVNVAQKGGGVVKKQQGVKCKRLELYRALGYFRFESVGLGGNRRSYIGVGSRARWGGL